jgi:acetolactate decarboxylase
MNKLGMLMALSLTALAAEKPYEVKWVGELHKVMMLGEDSGIIALDSLRALPHLYALGPVEGLNGEITVFDGDPVIGVVREGQPTVEHTFQLKAPLLVYTQVTNWTKTAIPPRIDTLAALDRFVTESARAAGLDMTAPFPFRVTGHMHEIAMHIVNRQGREAKGHEGHEKIEVKIPLTHATVEMLGFWSDRHAGVFTHQGANVHIHARTSDNKLSGHVDEVKIGAGELLLPAIQ